MQLSEFVQGKVMESINGVLSSTIPESKPGYKTTEFGTSTALISFLCTQAYITNDPSWAYAAAALTAVYVLARTFAKRG